MFEFPGAASPVSPEEQRARAHALQVACADYFHIGHRDAAGQPRYLNRLIHEKSPYLLQHAHQPVDWRPFDEAALAEARALDRPIFLSVGYSTCHWCHVMAQESFEDEAIAAFLNRHYIPIKVDREERPDVDEIYMGVVQILSGRGGWPMSVWLTPSAAPFFAGTYFPPRDGYRGMRHGFASVIAHMQRLFTEARDQVEAEALQLTEALRHHHMPHHDQSEASLGINAALLNQASAQLMAMYDEEHGGFGGAPKFPQPAQLEFALRQALHTQDGGLRDAFVHTLERMAAGGMYDQLGGGFHRYSVDGEWRVPHFEKMLYDNAQLTLTYLQGFQLTQRADFARIAEETLSYLMREMLTPQGLFYAAQDADSEGEEGRFFVWQRAQIEALLEPERARIVCAYFDVTESGNCEEAHMAAGENVLWRPLADEAVSQQLGIDVATLRQEIAAALPVLQAQRAQRHRPITDRKALTALNAMAITAFAKAAWVLGSERYLEVAKRGAAALLARAYQNGRLFHLADQRFAGEAFADDVAWTICALLALFECTPDPQLLTQAQQLQTLLDEEFAAPAGGYYLTGVRHPPLLVRPKQSHDGAVPSADSVTVHNLRKLYALTADARYLETAQRITSAHAAQLSSEPLSMPHLLSACFDWLHEGYDRVLFNVNGSAWGSSLRLQCAPGRLNICMPAAASEALTHVAPLLAGKAATNESTALFLCSHTHCLAPILNESDFKQHFSPPQT